MANEKEFVGQLPSPLNLGAADDRLSKAHLIYAFEGREGDLNKLKKKGSDIKAKLTDAINHENEEVVKALADAKKCKVDGIEPTGMPSEYTLRGYPKSSFDKLPKLYTYDQKEPYYSSGNQTEVAMPIGVDSQVSKDENKSTIQKMNDYNHYVRKAIECMVEVKIAETLKNGIEDNKSYELTLKQAAVLGF